MYWAKWLILIIGNIGRKLYLLGDKLSHLFLNQRASEAFQEVLLGNTPSPPKPLV